MSTCSMFHKCVALMIVLTFSVLVATNAEDHQMKVNVIADAIADAVRDVNNTSWPMVEYFLNYIGSNSTRQNITPIPTGRLIGKSPEYVEAYTTNYQAKQAGTMSDAEAMGILCLVGCGIGVCLMVWDYINQIEDSLSGCGSSFN